MKPLEDDDLILYLYREAEDPREIETRLAGSPELRDRLEALRRVLDAASVLPVPERPASYGADLWRRIEPRLGTPRDRRPFPVLWGLAAAALLLLAVGFWAGRTWPRTPRMEAARPIPAEARERILLATLAAHLESSERLLTEVTNAPDPENPTDLAAERAWARDLLAANRLYRRSAGVGGRPRLEALLDELEPFLLELAHTPDEPDAEELDDLRRRIEDRALLFKTRVASDRLERRKQTL